MMIQTSTVKKLQAAKNAEPIWDDETAYIATIVQQVIADEVKQLVGNALAEVSEIFDKEFELLFRSATFIWYERICPAVSDTLKHVVSNQWQMPLLRGTIHEHKDKLHKAVKAQ